MKTFVLNHDHDPQSEVNSYHPVKVYPSIDDMLMMFSSLGKDRECWKYVQWKPSSCTTASV